MRSAYSELFSMKVRTIGHMVVTVLPCARISSSTDRISSVAMPCQELGGALVAGVEGTGSYGYHLTRALRGAGLTVLEVNRPDRANVRRKGKSDTVDAEAAARAVLSGQASAVPKDRDGAVDALRALRMARSSAVKATTQPQPDQGAARGQSRAAARAADGEEPASARDPLRRPQPNSGMHTTLRSRRCGVSPVRASSGQRHRHRLNRGGDRAANNALWTIANNRLIHDPATREFAAKRRLQGDNRNEILRILKRYITREPST
jgi:transposase